jgi:hypothetical protein
MSMTEALIGAASGLVVGLVPFGYTVRKDKRERDERARADARKEEAEKQRELERQRERLRAAATRYSDLLGKAMALLEAVLVDADNADELLIGATQANGDLQGHAQGPLFAEFLESPPVIWSDRVCRTVLRKGLTLADDARAQRQTGDVARETQLAVRELTRAGIDVGGPRDLYRWASEEASKRWPDPLTSFEEEPWAAGLARQVATQLGFEQPP